MFRPAWLFRLLPLSALLGVAAFILVFTFSADSSPAADSAPHGAKPLPATRPVALAEGTPAPGHGDVGIKPGDGKLDRDEHGHGSGPAAKGPNSNEAPKQLTPEQVEDFLSILHEQNPGLEGRIRKAMADDPQKVNTEIVPHWLRLRQLIELKHTHPVLFELTLQDIRLSRQLDEQQRRFRNAHDPAVADAIRAELRQTLANRYDVRTKMVEEKTKAEVDQRLQNRDKAIDDELKRSVTQATTKPEPPRKRDGDGPRPDGGTPRK